MLLLPRPVVLRAIVPLQTALLAPLRCAGAVRRVLLLRDSENERLSRLAAELAVENARLNTANRLADRRDRLPGVRDELVHASVIARDLATMQRYLIVGRGLGDGVRPGTPAIVAEGVVGRVIAAGEHQALVQTLLDPDSRVAAVCPRSSVIGLVRADHGGRILLDFVDRDADVNPGDTVLTSGFGGVFPRGLLVGRVTAVGNRSPEIFLHVEIRPAAPIRRLETVFLYPLPGPIPEAGDWLDNLRPREVSIPGEER
ncbi:MAG: rod shape-determining protein MreC [bacterium]